MIAPSAPRSAIPAGISTTSERRSKSKASRWKRLFSRTGTSIFFFSSRRRHTRYWRDLEFRRVLFRSASAVIGTLVDVGAGIAARLVALIADAHRAARGGGAARVGAARRIADANLVIDAGVGVADV